MRNHSDTISDQQVVEKILINVTEKYECIVAITEETKNLSKFSIKELVGSFRAHEKQRFFREDQPKETVFQSKINENSQNFSKNHQKKKQKPKKEQDHDGSSKKVEEKGEKNSSLFCKVCKKTNHNAEKCWHKGKRQCNFCKNFGHVEKDCWHKKREQANFCEKQEYENLFFASKSDASTKNNEWYVDSGCSNHMTGDEKTFLSINNTITTKVKMGVLVDAKCKGTISINMKGCGKQIHDVLYVHGKWLFYCV
ncbi:uncharacterized protein [Solanum lycopersicum]|uniref:uncharacterized protein n=1 Tax=Solanum lycopersicum TaxID=4081 RepID=UPI003749AF7F